MALRDLPKERFPLHWDTYSKIYDQLNKAASRFADLGYDDLRQHCEETRDRLHQTWNAIVATERNEPKTEGR